MTEETIRWLLIVWLIVGATVLPLTLLITAPFGRHVNDRFGPSISNRVGWLMMESPAIWLFSFVFLTTATFETIAAWIFWAMWMFHYINRGIIYPLRIRTTGKKIPVLIVVFAFSFQMINGYANGISLGRFGDVYTAAWLTNVNVWAGVVLFIAGWCVNFAADEKLLKLRVGIETGYKAPEGGLYRWISCPNFLGEIVQWCGWALMCWNLASLSFAVWTIANLVPRAIAHHRWYYTQFEDYPGERKAILPYLL